MNPGNYKVVVDEAGIRRKINLGDLCFEKKLSASDVGHMNRLAIPKKAALEHFPSLFPVMSMTIRLVDMRNERYLIRYEYWATSRSYTFGTDWKNIIRDHGLQINDKIQIYHAPGFPLVYYIGYERALRVHCEKNIRWDRLLYEKKVLSTDIDGDRGLVIPFKSALQHFRPSKQEITFLDVDGKEWVMKPIWRIETQQYCLVEGWKAYVEFANIQVQDTIQIYPSTDNMRSVYGIHHCRDVMSNTKMMKLFGKYYIIPLGGDDAKEST